MNHRLNYKVWDKDRKCFIPNNGNPNIFPFNGGIGMTCDGNRTGHIDTSDYLQDSYIIVFSIGRTDKNGKLIFEGDLYRSPFMPKEDFYGNPCKGPIYEIKFECGESSSHGHGGSTKSEHYGYNFDGYVGFPNTIEIIGNIYQDPELMESKNDRGN